MGDTNTTGERTGGTVAADASVFYEPSLKALDPAAARAVAIAFDRNTRRHLIATGALVPRAQALAATAWIDEQPCLPIDAIARRAVGVSCEDAFGAFDRSHNVRWLAVDGPAGKR